MNQNIDKDELMDRIKAALKNEIVPIIFDTNIQPLIIEKIDDSNITFQCDVNYIKDLLINRYSSLILHTIHTITNKDYTFSVHSLEEDNEENSNKSNFEENSVELPNGNTYTKTAPGLNPKYTFDNFVVGNNNRFAHAAALAVGDNPAKTYNPLFIYGGSGLGKTHLMQAIGNKMYQKNNSLNIVYVTSEQFTNHLINSIRDGKNDPFRNKYRSADALLIDDIQFLEDRLKSRFEWGLLADISCPDYETKVAILRKKALDENIIIDDEILANIATKIDSNIRELEGAFNKILARAYLMHCPITIELAENVINEFISKKEKVISSDYIQETVAKYFSIDKKDIIGEKRSNDIAFPRQIAMYLCREVANMSFPQIGVDFGKRDHSTVMHAYKKIEKEIKEKPNTKLIVESVKNIILNVES